MNNLLIGLVSAVVGLSWTGAVFGSQMVNEYLVCETLSVPVDLSVMISDKIYLELDLSDVKRDDNNKNWVMQLTFNNVFKPFNLNDTWFSLDGSKVEMKRQEIGKNKNEWLVEMDVSDVFGDEELKDMSNAFLSLSGDLSAANSQAQFLKWCFLKEASGVSEHRSELRQILDKNRRSLVESSHMAVKVNPFEEECRSDLDKSDKLAVRCCGRGQCISAYPGTRNCLGSIKSYIQAVKICTGLGEEWSVCTKQQATSPCLDSGCNYSFKQVWTSETCGRYYTSASANKVVNVESRSESCGYHSDIKAAVRCCNDNEEMCISRTVDTNICFGQRTFDESENICQGLGNGWSLCSVSQLNGMCRDSSSSGCSYDSTDVWSNEQC